MSQTLLPTVNLEYGNILIVDDDPEILFIIKNSLEGQPAKLYTATTGSEALAQLRQFDFDVLLLDARLPDINGFEICRMVKSSPQWQHIKVLMVSANSNFDDKVRAYEIGADDYIVKPFRNKEFQARIRVMLNLSLAERGLTKRNAQLLEIISTFQKINAKLDLRTIADTIVAAACRLTNADRGYLALWDEKRQAHRITSWLNPSSDIISTLVPEGVGLAGLVRQRGVPVYIGDEKNIPKQINHVDDCSYAGVGIPLNVDHRQIGVLTVYMTNPEKQFITSDVDILNMLTERAAITIEVARLYDQLSRSEERYRLLTEKASDLIITLDQEGHLTYVNERSISLLRYEPAEMIGRSFQDFLAEESQDKLAEIYQSYIRRSKPTTETEPSKSYELLLLTHEAEPINLEFNFGIMFQDGDFVGFQAIGRDITVRKHLDELERMRLLGQMSSGVAHDFNNVLANILGHAQLLAQDIEDGQTRQVLQIIEQSARDGAETVRRIQEFTNNQQSQKNLEGLDVNQVVQSAIDLSRPRWRDLAQAHGVNIVIEKDFGEVKPIQAKAASLREALLNLINNAIDAMADKGGTLGFRTFMVGKMVTIEVYDTGAGMESEVRRHIFEPYYTTKGMAGTGLGLSITYGIITRFGGQITCQSTLGLGTTFSIKLPKAKLPTTEKPQTEATTSVKKFNARYSGRILAVDDEANIRSIVKRALQLNGFEVVMASSGQEALDLLAQAAQTDPLMPYDLVLSDLGMPGIGGWEVASAIQHNWSGVPVVLVTGWGDQLDSTKLEQVAVRHTLSKPFNINDLISIAARLIPQP